ncbi:MAG: hypothetical protein AMXMBFR82_39290 [Candidatus Hydrogenedentota bacterium]
MRWNRRWVFCVVTVFSLAFAGCGLKNGGIEFGPVSFSLPVAAGVFDASVYPEAESLPLATGVVEMDLCTLPTEDELTEVFRQAGEIDLSSFVELSRVELRRTVLHASSGDFRDVKAIQVYFVPRYGSIFNTVNLGGAFSLTGFGNTIEIEPAKDVDLLELIRENDAIPGADCPKLRVRVTGSAPDEAIAWDAQIDVDAYALLDVF